MLFGIVNEPQANYDGAQDAQVWATMNAAVQTIRDVETAAGTPHHVVTVQGTRSWARVLDYYLTHPITAGGGVNIAYETHVYDAPSLFADRFERPSATLPRDHRGVRSAGHDGGGRRDPHGERRGPRGPLPGVDLPHAMPAELARGQLGRDLRRGHASHAHLLGRPS